MVTMVQEEGYTTSRPIPSIVHSKFTARQLHIPVILSRVNKMPQHILQRLSVSTLSLFVRLWVRCSGHTLVKAKQVTDFNKELRGEEPILIRHQELGDPMQPEYLSHKDLSKLRSTHVIPARSKMHHLAQPVHNSRVMLERANTLQITRSYKLDQFEAVAGLQSRNKVFKLAGLLPMAPRL